MGEDALERRLEHTFKVVARAICEVVSGWEFSGFAVPIEEVEAGNASGFIANGAEQVTKALCVYLGISYAFTQDVKELAELTVQFRVSPNMQNFDGPVRAGSPQTDIQKLSNRLSFQTDVLHSSQRL